MNPFQAMVLRVARSVTASMSPSERKKMVMDLYKRFKGQGDASIKGGKHQIMLATEDYATVVLEDADDAELNRIYTKYDVANWLKKFGKTATEFATPEALEKYLKSHPNADKSKHSVKKDVSYVPKRHPDEVRKEVNSLSPAKMKEEISKLPAKSKARFEEVHGQLGHIKDEHDRNRGALHQVKGEENYEKVETERKPKKKAATAAGRVAEAHSVRWMQEAAENLNKASGRLIDAEGYMGGTLDLLVEALKFIKAANVDISDDDTRDLEREMASLIRQADSDSRGIVNQIRELRAKVKDAREQYGDEITWELQHPNGE